MHRAPPAALPVKPIVAWALVGDRDWRVTSGATVLLSSKAAGSGMRGARLGFGNRPGVCGVAEGGETKFIIDK